MSTEPEIIEVYFMTHYLRALFPVLHMQTVLVQST